MAWRPIQASATRSAFERKKPRSVVTPLVTDRFPLRHPSVKAQEIRTQRDGKYKCNGRQKLQISDGEADNRPQNSTQFAHHHTATAGRQRVERVAREVVETGTLEAETEVRIEAAPAAGAGRGAAAAAAAVAAAAAAAAAAASLCSSECGQAH